MRCFLYPLSLLTLTCAIISRSATKGNQQVEKFNRERRHLIFPEPRESETKVQVLFGLGLPMEGEISMTLGYVLKCNYNLPYNASDFSEGHVRLKRTTDDKLPRQKKDENEVGLTTRWTLYRLLETALARLGSGKACLLRAVCEAAANPFDEGQGLLGQLLHVFLTPSTTFEEYEIYSDREYHAAEAIGKNSRGTCGSLYSECEYNPLDYFTALVRL